LSLFGKVIKLTQGGVLRNHHSCEKDLRSEREGPVWIRQRRFENLKKKKKKGEKINSLILSYIIQYKIKENCEN